MAVIETKRVMRWEKDRSIRERNLGSAASNSICVLLIALTVLLSPLQAYGIQSTTEAKSQSTEASVSLKAAADGRFVIGVGVPAAITSRKDDWPLLFEHFQILTPENCMKPQAVQPVEGGFRFEACDQFVEFAQQNNLDVVGHCLVWAKDDRTPAWWLTKDGQPTDRQTLLSRLKTHVETVAGRYGDKIQMWDVVNEALADGDGSYLRDSVWSRTCDEEFIVKAFQYARASAPNALLIYNDYRCDMPDKREKLVRLIRSLKEQNAPVDAVGLQGHYELDSIPFDGLEAMFKAMRELEVKVVVSELDIDVVTRGKWWADNNKYREELKTYDPYKDGCPEEILQRQAEQYAKLFQLFCRYDDVICRVSFWNLHDGQSWLNYFPWNRVNHPLLFDRQRQPKPAYDAVVQALKETEAAVVKEPQLAGLTVHPASYTEVEDWKAEVFAGRKLWLSPVPLLDSDAVSSAVVEENEGGVSLLIEFTDVGGEILFEHTSTHLMEPVALMIDGQLITAPKIYSAIRKQASIAGGFSKDELLRLSEKINQK